MKLNTKHFGEMEISEDKIIEFSEGLPGFAYLNKFVLLTDSEEADNIFYWLQSTDDVSIAFIMVDTLKYMPDYNPIVQEDEIKPLMDSTQEDLVYYNIMVLPENIKDATINLKAPVVINEALKRGKQVICTNEEYEIKHYMFR